MTRAVSGEGGAGGQPLVDQEIGDILELADFRDLEDVIAAVVEIVAGPSHGADRGVGRDDAREGDGFLGLGGAALVHGVHGSFPSGLPFPNSSSSFLSSA